MRILVVDDSAVCRITLKTLLSLRDHQVVAEAASQADAVDAYQKYRPDLVTLDLSLGKDSGLNALRAIRMIDPNAKVVIVTGCPQADIRDKAFSYGAAGFLNKPVTMKDLENMMYKALSKA